MKADKPSESLESVVSLEFKVKQEAQPLATPLYYYVGNYLFIWELAVLDVVDDEHHV